MSVRKLVTEAVGTFILVFFAVGSAVFGVKQVGPVGVALAFGLVLLALAYAIGPVSGCHVNPAVTLGVLLARRISPREAGGLHHRPGHRGDRGRGVPQGLRHVGRRDRRDGCTGDERLGQDDQRRGRVRHRGHPHGAARSGHPAGDRPQRSPGFAGLVIGLTLTVVHLVGIPLTGTSVNPARSIGPALFEGGEALKQLWLFIVAPMVGGALAWVVWPFVRADEDPDPQRAESVQAARDAATRVPRKRTAKR